MSQGQCEKKSMWSSNQKLYCISNILSLLLGTGQRSLLICPLGLSSSSWAVAVNLGPINWFKFFFHCVLLYISGSQTVGCAPQGRWRGTFTGDGEGSITQLHSGPAPFWLCSRTCPQPPPTVAPVLTPAAALALAPTPILAPLLALAPSGYMNNVHYR